MRSRIDLTTQLTSEQTRAVHLSLVSGILTGASQDASTN